MSDLVLSWVAMGLTVLVVSTQQSMHIIKTQTLQIRVASGDPAGSYHKMVLWSLINLRHSEKERSEVANSKDLQCIGSTYPLYQMKSRQFYRMHCGV